MALDIWLPETLRSLPPESMPWSTAVEFHGGMLDGRTKQLPMMGNVFGPIPFAGHDCGRPVCHWYVLTGWHPDRSVWVFTLDDDG
jgi:hypothetical protein